jgi:hypothetical protein
VFSQARSRLDYQMGASLPETIDVRFFLNANREFKAGAEKGTPYLNRIKKGVHFLLSRFLGKKKCTVYLGRRTLQSCSLHPASPSRSRRQHLVSLTILLTVPPFITVPFTSHEVFLPMLLTTLPSLKLFPCSDMLAARMPRASPNILETSSHLVE